MPVDDRQLIEIAVRGIIERGDLEGLRHGIVKFNPDGTNPAKKPFLVPVQIDGTAERKFCIVPPELDGKIINLTPVWVRRGKRKRWEIEKIDRATIQDASSGTAGRSTVGGSTTVKTPVGSGGGGTGILGVKYGGSGADHSGSGGTGKFVKQKTTGGAFAVETIANSELPTVGLDKGGTNTNLSGAVDGYVIKSGTGMVTRALTVSTSAPTVGDDSADGYGFMSAWWHYDPGGGGEDDLYFCFDATVGSADWRKLAIQSKYAVFSSLRSNGSLQSLPASGDSFYAYGGSITLHKTSDTDYPTVELLQSHVTGTSNPQSGDILGAFRVRGYNASGTYADIRVVATENHTGSSRGNKIEIYTVKNGTNTPAKRATIEDTGRAVYSPDTSVAPINLTPAAEPSTLAQGDEWYNSTRKTHGYYPGGIVGHGVYVLGTLSAVVDVNNTAVETTVFSVTLPANFFAVKRTLRLTLYGYFRTNGTTVNVQHFGYLGGTEIWRVIRSATTTTIRGVSVDAISTCYTIGGTGTVWSQAKGIVYQSSQNDAKTSALTLDTTASQVYSVTMQWETANANNLYTATNVILEVIG